MTKTILLHIGFGKTGTSAIQQYLFQNRDALMEQRVLYPIEGTMTGHGHHGLSEVGMPDINQVVRERFNRLLAEIDAAACATVIISSEQFCFCHPRYVSAVAKELRKHNVQVLFYVRHQSPLVESTFLEWVKVGKDYGQSVMDFYARHKKSFDFVRLINPWIDSFGKDAIRARLYDRRNIGPDVRIDFCRVSGIDQALLASSPGQANTSLLPEFFQLLSELDNAKLDRITRRRLVSELLDLSRQFSPCRSRRLVDEELERAIASDFAVSNREFADQFLTPEEATLLVG